RVPCQPPPEIGGVMMRKGPHGDATNGGALHSPTRDRVRVRIHVDGGVSSSKDHEEIPEGVQRRTRERRALGADQLRKLSSNSAGNVASTRSVRSTPVTAR